MAKICQETRIVPKNDPRISSDTSGLKRANHADINAEIPMLNNVIPQIINLVEICLSKNPAIVMNKKPKTVRTINVNVSGRNRYLFSVPSGCLIIVPVKLFEKRKKAGC